jgi:hypothetical protein
MVIMLAFMIVVLLGMAALVLDLGIYYREKASLQGVADAAALAAANKVPNADAAAAVALQVMEENGYVFGQKGVMGIDTILNPDGAHPARYLVRLRKSMPAYFSHLLGHSGSQLEATATSVFLVKGIVPWIFYLPDTDTFSYDQPYTLKQGALGGETGNFGCLRLSGSGSDKYLEDLMYGYQSFLELGAELQTEPGNKSGPTKRGVDYRIRSDDLNDRIVICPATRDLVPHGASETLTVHGFAAFRLVSATRVGDECYVQATFLNFKTIPWALGGLRICLID